VPDISHAASVASKSNTTSGAAHGAVVQCSMASWADRAPMALPSRFLILLAARFEKATRIHTQTIYIHSPQGLGWEPAVNDPL